jgi:hypothetical protein
MKPKNLQIIIPTLIGLLITFSFMLLLNWGLEKFYFLKDPDPVFDFSVVFWIEIYLIAFLPTLAVAILIQLLFINRIWKTYKLRKNIMGLKLWQLVFVSCLIFGIVVAVFNWNSFFGTKTLILHFVTATTISLLYWTTNFLAIKFVEEKTAANNN